VTRSARPTGGAAPGPIRRGRPRPSAALLRWFRAHRRPLPWRTRRTPYRVWLAEVLLQQTRNDQARPYFERIVRRFPTVAALAGATEAEVLKLWEGAGYYARARHLHRTAQIVVRAHAGRFPREPDALRRLPGVGPYIANAVASLAFGAPVLALDANGLRVGARWLAETRDLGRAPVRAGVEAYLRSILPPGSAGEFNEALMELGETVCLPRSPRCPDCPVARQCRARQELPDPSRIPARHRRPPKPTIEAAVVGARRGPRWLVQQRPPEGLLGGLWELPGGKLAPGEVPVDAARRELREETGLSPVSLTSAGTVRHEYSHFRVRLHLYLAPAVRGRLREATGRRRWVTDAEFDALARPVATVRAMDRLRRLLPARR
jgi:A/G-specific adenine glycosylase